MARQNTRPRSSLKSMEAYSDFSGGLNTMSDQTKMADTEVALLINMDISPRGTLVRRTGMVNHKRGAIWGDIKGKTWAQLNEEV
ncbi:hypothetical protein [Metabacillus sp. cB07]|uniref:hypothetical protein n=1 Tax=Metabacillus sp. cB07 TaxID=2806989 RepID=UPI00193A8FE7|nr:hypothetical protein [Metabacillus sp. cB07]